MHRLWQLLLKGHDEVRMAPDPLVSARMALLRVLHACDLPDPGKLLKRMEELSDSGAVVAASPFSEGAREPAKANLAWEQLVEQVERAGQHHVAAIMKLQVRVVELEEGRLVYSRAAEFSDDVTGAIKEALSPKKDRRCASIRWSRRHSRLSPMPSSSRTAIREANPIGGIPHEIDGRDD